MKKLNRRQMIASFLMSLPGLRSANALFDSKKVKPLKKDNLMNVVLHKANERGTADHGWLKSKHSFSFASWYNPEKMGFGLLRVINDDQVSPSQGFGTHPHRDMEIISIPLSGALKHKDSEGNEAIIKSGEVQLMSAGVGVAHSEYNASNSEDVKFLQIWVMPQKLGITPRYDQKEFDVKERKNKWQTVVSPMDNEEPGVKINQQAWFSLVELDDKQKINYDLKKKGNGVYFFVLEGELDIAEQTLKGRDAVGVDTFESLPIVANSKARLLAIEVPMG